MDYSGYIDKRLSKDQIEASTNLIEDSDLQKEATDLLEQCRNYYDQLSDFRDERERARNFYIGDHWEEVIEDPDNEGEYITEGQHIMNQGKVPLKQNQIRQVVKNLIGQYRDNDSKSVVISRQREKAKIGEMLTNALHTSLDRNKTKELDVRVFEEFLISGAFAWKTSYGMIDKINREDVINDPVHPARMFFNTGLTDIRLKELHTVGEFMDTEIDDLVAMFAENEADKEKIKEWYRHHDGDRSGFLSTEQQGPDSIDDDSFYLSSDPNKCRVFEVWQQKLELVTIVHDKHTAEWYETEEDIETLEMQNEMRKAEALAAGVPEENLEFLEMEITQDYQKVWYFWFLTPFGQILKHGKTPYNHEDHPYTIGLYPLIDGKIFGLVHDIIDQQISINRLITLLDFMIGSSAKGVLLFPEEMLPDGYTMDDISDEWSRHNGVIAFKPNKNYPNLAPKEVQGNSRNVGAMDMLQMQFGLLEKISGVNDAIQGHKPNSGTPSSLYAQQTHNATLSNRDFFEFFFAIKQQRDFKSVKLIQQYYDDERYIATGGKDYDDEARYYDPNQGRDAEVDILMGQNNSTLYRQMLDEYLMKFLEGGLIDLDMFLEATSLPFADKLKEISMRKQKEMQQLQESGQQESDPQTMGMIQQMLGAA